MQEMEGYNHLDKINISWENRKYLILKRSNMFKFIKQALKILNKEEPERFPVEVDASKYIRVLRLAERIAGNKYFAVNLDENEGVNAMEFYFTQKELMERGLKPINAAFDVMSKRLAPKGTYKMIEDQVRTSLMENVITKAKQEKQEKYIKPKVGHCPSCNHTLVDGKDILGHCYTCPNCGEQACGLSGVYK